MVYEMGYLSWWRHQMETFSALLAFCEGNPPVTGGFPSQRPVTRSFDIFFDLRRNKRLSKQSRRRWFETPSCHITTTIAVTWKRRFDPIIVLLPCYVLTGTSRNCVWAGTRSKQCNLLRCLGDERNQGISRYRVWWCLVSPEALAPYAVWESPRGIDHITM